MENPLRFIANEALHSSVWKTTSRWIRGQENYTGLGLKYNGDYVNGEVLVYFGDTVSKSYQLEQWIPVLEELHKTHRVALLFRRPSAADAISRVTRLPIVFKSRFQPMSDYLYATDFKLAIYVNNGVTNFQPLGFAPIVHVHVNHGESDKISMVSNQAKAYDKVFVAGQAAIDRHHRALLDFDDSHLVSVGRPQLDIPRTSGLPTSDRHTIMYAPTWQGENEANNYTSVDCYGPQIARAILSIPDVRLVYKPHPRVEDSSVPELFRANQEIIDLINAANEHGGDHIIEMQGDILGMFDDVDLLVTDISSVGLDFLYLKPHAPMIITDRRTDTALINADSPITRAVPLIDEANIDSVKSMLEAALQNDSGAQARNAMRTYYFGDGEVGSSMKSFIKEIDRLISNRKTDLDHFDKRTANVGLESDDESPREG